MIGYSALLVQESKRIARVSPEHATKLRNFADVVSRSAEYCHQLADNWRQTASKTADYDEIDLVKLVQEVREMIFFNNSVIECAGLPQALIRGSSFELTRVLQNMFKNALEAGASSVVVSFDLQGNDVRMAISDNGSGMSQETIGKALKGGFTTKAHGTGLGLGICRHLIGAHGAALAIESVEGKGTTIYVTFPAPKLGG
jgi:signal transduction histidine kinase